MHTTAVARGRGTWLPATLALALALTAAACEGGAGASGNDTVTIPSSDGSSPSIVLDAHFNVEQRGFLSVSDGSAPEQASVDPEEVVTFIANGSDTDGGVKTVQIWADVKTCSATIDDVATCSQPLLGLPVAENADPDDEKEAGDSAARSRVVTYNLAVPGGSGSLNAKVWAVVENFSGETRRTPNITISEP